LTHPRRRGGGADAAPSQKEIKINFLDKTISTVLCHSYFSLNQSQTSGDDYGTGILKYVIKET